MTNWAKASQTKQVELLKRWRLEPEDIAYALKCRVPETEATRLSAHEITALANAFAFKYDGPWEPARSHDWHCFVRDWIRDKHRARRTADDDIPF